MPLLPSAKVTTQSVTSLVVAVVAAVALHIYGIDLDSGSLVAIGSAVGWAAGIVAGFRRTEVRPPPSSFAHLPPEVMPPR